MSHGPVEDKHDRTMNEVGELLAKKFKGYGFCLLVFDLNVDSGRMNYLSNAERADMITAMKEFIAHNEGRVGPSSATFQ